MRAPCETLTNMISDHIFCFPFVADATIFVIHTGLSVMGVEQKKEIAPHQNFPQSINQGVLEEIIVRSEIDFCLVKILLNSC